MTVVLGDKYEDEVTKYVGTATARTETLHGTTSVCLERADNEGKPEEIWLPELRLRPADDARKVGIHP